MRWKVIVAAAGQIGVESLVAESVVSFAMVFIRPRFGGHVHRAGGSEFRGEIERGLLNLKFLNAAGGDVLRGGTYRFIADVESIHFDAGGAAEPAAE